ncbi:MAG: nucleotidyltransferase domain-containing protein [Deltaproteobacteria bacterium]|nr:nucleotidyltransferase domain-containing protein [Deltaproteobacteria bacterium]
MIEEKIRSYFEDRQGIIAVYLFGSYAMGKERLSSDVDIGLLLDTDESDATAIKDICMAELARLLRKDIHPVILNSAGETLLKQIFSKGKCVVINDRQKLARYRTAKFSQIAAFGPYRRQMQQGLIQRVMEGRLLG